MLFSAGPQVRRWVLWGLLVILVLSMLSTLVWLAGRYEVSQVQSRIERDAADAVSDIRTALTRNVQSLQALQYADRSSVTWSQDANALLREHREWLRLELRDTELHVLKAIDTPFRAPAFNRYGRAANQPEVVQACGVARRQSGPGYGASTYVPQADGLGIEIMDLCLPVITDGKLTGYTVATYSLGEILVNMVGPQLTRSQEVSSPRQTAHVWPCMARHVAVHACSSPNSSLTCPVTPWCCVWTAGAAHLMCSPMC
jgi:two-component system sensor histidine kinase DctS